MATRYRVGNGFDFHPLEAGRRLVLGGVEIKHDKGLARPFGRRRRGACARQRDPRCDRRGRPWPAFSRQRSALQRRRLDRAARGRLEARQRSRMAAGQRRPDDFRREAEAEAVSRCDARAARRRTRRGSIARQRESLEPRGNRRAWPWRRDGGGGDRDARSRLALGRALQPRAKHRRRRTHHRPNHRRFRVPRPLRRIPVR